MNASNPLVHGALASLLAVGLASATSGAFAAKGDNEKCAGIVKAGQNDCGTSRSACAGTAKADNDGEAWIFVPAGTCARIAGGMVVTDKPGNVHGGAAAMKKG